MGGGASKANANKDAGPSSESPKNKNNNNNINDNMNKVYGPKNGELAPLPYTTSSLSPNNTNMNTFYAKPTWNDSVPLQPIISNKSKVIPREETPVVPISVIPTPLEPKPKPKPPSPTSSQPPSSISNSIIASSPSPTHLTTPSNQFEDLVVRGHSPTSISAPPQPFTSSPSPVPPSSSPPHASVLSSSPAHDEPRNISPPPLSMDQFKNKNLLLERKLSEGINSPITRFKPVLAGSAEKFSAHNDEDQVIVDDEEDEQANGKEKSNADKYYENFSSDKPKHKNINISNNANYSSNNSSAINTPVSAFKRQLQHASSVTFHLSDSEEEGEEENERLNTAEVSTARKNVVPTLKLTDIGGMVRPRPPVAAVAKPAPEAEVAPIPKNHGNFDNDKFRAANAKKKAITDSIFKQTTYDYKAQEISPNISTREPSARDSSSSPGASSQSSSVRSSDYETSSLGYSSDTSQESPNFTRPQNTPTQNKPAYDDYEESLISSILNEPKTPA